jgi:spermidine/putrescine-binding protein
MGLGINKDYFGGKLPTPSWSLIFEEPKQAYSICMTDIAREAVMLAGYYLFKDIDSLSEDDRLAVIKTMLERQKKWVEVYSDARVEELLVSGSCPIAVGVSPDIFKSMRENKAIEFVIPREGTFLSINSFVLPKTTKKEDLVYELLNYLYQPDILIVSSKQYGFCPPIKNVPNHTHGIFCPDAKQLSTMEFFRNVLSPDEIQEVWVSVLAH